MNNYIKIKNLTKKYEKNKSIKVLNDITFNFEPGKTYSIMGPSGSGKSTLLNLLSLIDNPTSGSIEINSNKIKPNNKVENDLIRAKKIGIIYQDKNLLSDFTALENVYLPNLLISKKKQNTVFEYYRNNNWIFGLLNNFGSQNNSKFKFVWIVSVLNCSNCINSSISRWKKSKRFNIRNFNHKKNHNHNWYSN